MYQYQKYGWLLLGSALLAGRVDAAHLRVVATTSLIADVARAVGGDNANVSELIPRATDPHAFDPTPREMARLQTADVVLANGLGLESFLEKILAADGAKQADRLVIVSTGRAPRGNAHHHESEEEAESEEEHHHGETDPHVWLDPTWVQLWADNIAAAFAARDPGNADAYRSRAKAYQGELNALDDWMRNQLAPIPPARRVIVTDHDEFGYLADRYGITVTGALLPNFTTVTEVSARGLADLQDKMRTSGARVIVVSHSANPAMAERVARDTGGRVIRLYTHSLGPPGSETATYLDLMRYNLRTLADALQETTP